MKRGKKALKVSNIMGIYLGRKVKMLACIFLGKNHVTMKKVVEPFQYNQPVDRPVAQRHLWRWFLSGQQLTEFLWNFQQICCV